MLGQAIPLSIGVVGAVARTEQLLVLSDASQHPNYYPGVDAVAGMDQHKTTLMSVAIRVSSPSKAFLVVSLKRALETTLMDKRSDEMVPAFTADDASLLSTMCHAALAMVATAVHVADHRNFAEAESKIVREGLARASADVAAAKEDAEAAAERAEALENLVSDQRALEREFAVRLSTWDPLDVATSLAQQQQGRLSPRSMLPSSSSSSSSSLFLEEEGDRLDYDGVGKAMVSFIEQQVLKRLRRRRARGKTRRGPRTLRAPRR